jgi:hypothetical protein
VQQKHAALLLFFVAWSWSFVLCCTVWFTGLMQARRKERQRQRQGQGHPGQRPRQDLY